MSEQKFIYGFSQYQLQALNVPYQKRDECLVHYVPYWKCFLNMSFSQKIFNKRACLNEKTKYNQCFQTNKNKYTAKHLMTMKIANPEKFQQLNVSPTLQSQYNPSFFNYKRH